MPPGSVHHYYWKLVFPAATVVFATIPVVVAVVAHDYLNDTLKICAFSELGYVLGNWIDPDLDEIAYTSQEARMTRQIPILGIWLAAWFMIYARYMAVLAKWLHLSRPLMGVHRSKLTHSVVPGTITRIIWLNLFFYGVASMAMQTFRFQIYGVNSWIFHYFVGQFIGLGISDALHISLDKKEEEYER